MIDPLFTVFTPTFNRAHTLHRAFDSLGTQTLRDFEWLVVDDGSTDDTGELVAAWTSTADFPIRYVKREHGGKHKAHNLALVEARGRFFCILDSDDALVPDALDKLLRLWNSIPENERSGFCSVGARCCDQTGRMIGDAFPADPFDADMRELEYVYRVGGEKWIAWVTEIFRRYPFPDIGGTQFIPEGLICFDIAKTFKGRWVNDVVRIYYIDDPKIGATLSRRKLGEHALGRWYYYSWLLNNNLEYFFWSPMPFIKGAAALPLCGWAAGFTVRRSLDALRSGWAKLLVWLLLPLSASLYCREIFRERRSRNMVRA